MKTHLPDGDPSGGSPRKVQVPLFKAELNRIDDVRFAQRHQSRTEAIRYLIMKGLEAAASDPLAPS